MCVHQLLEPCSQHGVELVFCGHAREEARLRNRGGCVSLLNQRQPIGNLNALLYSTSKNINTLSLNIVSITWNTDHRTASPAPLLWWVPLKPCPSSTLTCASVHCNRRRVSVEQRTQMSTTTSCPQLGHCLFRSVHNRRPPSYGIFEARAHCPRRLPHR